MAKAKQLSKMKKYELLLMIRQLTERNEALTEELEKKREAEPDAGITERRSSAESDICFCIDRLRNTIEEAVNRLAGQKKESEENG